MKKIFNFRNKKTIFLLVLCLLFILLSILTLNNNLVSLDDLVHKIILSIRSNFLTMIFRVTTHAATSYFLIILTIILFIIIKNKKIPIYIALNLTFSFLTNEMAKGIFTRERPIGINLINETSYSYPSGHSMVGFAYYGFLIYLIRKYVKDNKLKNIFTFMLIINILLIGFTRIYLGVHYLTDVIGGFLLGSIFLIIYTSIIKLEKK